MKFRTIDQAREVASILTMEAWTPLTCSERLQRWADLLEQWRGGELQLLYGTEFALNARRAALRDEQSPLTIAFADLLLRAHGLNGDSYGAGRLFFGLSDRALHNIVCYCYYSASKVPSNDIASRVRRAARRARRAERVIAYVGLNRSQVERLLLRFLV